MPIRPENRKRYPKDWREISKRIRFGRAGGRCEFTTAHGLDRGHDEQGRCTARHGKPHPITGSTVVLTVAHLDHVPENCADENLLAGCQRCHNTYDAPMRQKGIRERREAQRRRVIEKAGQIAFELECETGRKVARK